MSDLIERYVSRVAIIEQGGGDAVLVIDTVTNYAVEVICNGYDKVTQSHIELGSQIAKALNTAWQNHTSELATLCAKLDVAREAWETAAALIQEAKGFEGERGGPITDHLDFAESVMGAALATIEGQSDEG